MRMGVEYFVYYWQYLGINAKKDFSSAIEMCYHLPRNCTYFQINGGILEDMEAENEIL